MSSWRHMIYLQDGVQGAFEAALADYIALSQDFFIDGAVITATPVGSDIQYDITAGYACVRKEVMPVEAVTVVKASTQVVFLEVVDVADDVTPVVNLDGTTDYVMRKRTLKLKVANVYPTTYMSHMAPRKSTLDILRFKGRMVMPGAMSAYYGDMANFSVDGRGIAGTVMDGWAICNGLNGTPDMRGMVPLGATSVPDSGAGPVFDGVNANTNVGDKVGQDLLTIEAANLPAHTHPFTYQSVYYNGGAELSTGGGAIRSPFTNETDENETPNEAIDVRQPSFALVWIMSIV
jgi:hypothetical protein